MSGNTKRTKTVLEPRYDFDRKGHKRSIKVPNPLPKFYQKKTPCEKIYFRNSNSLIQIPVHSVKASCKTLVWVLMRTLDKNNKVPAWSAFQSITTDYPNLCEVNVGYLPAIYDTPTKYEVIKEILVTAETCRNELDLNYIFLEADQAIYHKILDVKFQLPDQFETVIVRMGGFHLIMCLMRCIYSRFRGFVFVELLSELGDLGGPGTIESALKGSDVKLGVRLYKLLFEAFYRMKLQMLEQRSLISESKDSIKLKKLIEHSLNDFDCKMNFTQYSTDNLDNLLNHSILTTIFQTRTGGDLAFWIDSYLEMVHLLLNIIHFQRCGN